MCPTYMASAGIAMHGEAYLAPWKLVSSEKQDSTTTAKFTVDLPLLQETFTRQFRMVDGENVVYVNSELQSNVAFDRTANWGEHPFLYPPFLEPEKTVVDMSGTRAKTRPATRAGHAAAAGKRVHLAHDYRARTANSMTCVSSRQAEAGTATPRP